MKKGTNLMDDFTATMIVEGEEEVETEEEFAEAVQHLINTGLAWSLQGFFGRTANQFIEAGLCHHKE